MNPTHQKKPYLAEAIQWDGTNTQAVMDLMPDDVGADLRKTHNSEPCMMIRHKRAITTISPGWWVVRGENGVVKLYNDATFKVKYQPYV